MDTTFVEPDSPNRHAPGTPDSVPACMYGIIVSKNITAMKRLYAAIISTLIATSATSAYSTETLPTAPPYMSAKGVEIVGNVVASKPEEGKTSGSAHLGMYKVNTATGEFTRLTTNTVSGGYGAWVIDDVYYSSAYYRDNGRPVYGVLGYDMSTWKQVSKMMLDQKRMATTAVADADGKVYGTFPNSTGQGHMLANLDMASGSLVKICDVESPWAAMSIASDNYIYAIDNTGILWKVLDKSTGAMTKVGNTGLAAKYLCGGCIDTRDDKFYYSCNPEDGSGKLYEINIRTAQATLLQEYKYSDQITGIYFPFTPSDKAPGDPVMALQFPEGSLSGSVDITTPSTTADGEAASGTLTYVIWRDGVQAASGSASYGSNVSVPMTLDEDRNYVFKVQLSNEAGVSRTAKQAMFIGMATPKAPTGLKNTYADGRFSLSWNKVTTSVAGGYMPQITYNVVRMSGNVTVASGIAENSFSESIDTPDRYVTYYYKVTAVNNTKTSEETVSPKIGLGVNDAPWFCDFSDPESFFDFTVINVPKNKKTWAFDNHPEFGPTVNCSQGFVAKDDWLILPPMKLEGGCIYKFSFETRTGLFAGEEKIEAKVGNAPTAEGMSVEVIPVTVVTGRNAVRIEGQFTPAANGTYYFGIHALTPKGGNWVYADNITVSRGIKATAPAAPEALVIPDPDGEKKITVTGTAPSKTVNGQSLSDITRMDVFSNRRLLKTVTGIAPGGSFNIEAVADTIGEQTVSVMAYNESGAGESLDTMVYVGINKPTEVTDIKIVETSVHGRVTASWTPPALDVTGKPLNPSKVTYSITDVTDGNRLLAENLTEPRYTFTAVEEGKRQKFIQVAVRAHTMSGHSYEETSPLVPAGEPDAYPWLESFANGAIKHIIGQRSVNADLINTYKWTINTDASLANMKSYDGDNGYAAGRAKYEDYSGEIFTGKIDLRKAVKPELSFATLSIPGGSADLNEIVVAVKKSGMEADFTPVFSKSVKDICCNEENVWRTARVNLSAFKGQQIEISIKAVTKNYEYTFIDALNVAEGYDCNLAVSDVKTPDHVEAGTDFDITVNLQNKGSVTAANYAVELYLNDDKEAFAVVDDGAAINAGAYGSVSFRARLPHDASDENILTAKVILAGDEDLSDNVSDDTKLRILRTARPAPSDLAVNASGETYDLTWTAPDLSGWGGKTDDDIESYDSFANFNVGDWRFADMDRSPIGGFQNKEVPNNPKNSLGSFFVFDRGDGSYWDDSYKPHSGTKFLASMFRYDNGTSDDWLISPELSGKAQTVRFWAKSYSAEYPEKIETRYSTAGRDIDSFILSDAVNAVPGTWTEYTIDIPAGGKYFAIRNCATGAFLLMLDDFSFDAAVPVLDGYNVYRNGVRLNDRPVTATTYSDPKRSSDSLRYYVTAVYSGEESRASNVAGIISAVDGTRSNAVIRIAANTIFICNADEVTVADIDGRLLHKSLGNPEIRISVLPGIYLVRTDGTTRKVIVR